MNKDERYSPNSTSLKYDGIGVPFLAQSTCLGCLLRIEFRRGSGALSVLGGGGGEAIHLDTTDKIFTHGSN